MEEKARYPGTIRTCSAIPHREFNSRAASQNSCVRSTPVNEQLYRLAIQRAGPPIPHPISRIVSPACGWFDPEDLTSALEATGLTYRRAGNVPGFDGLRLKDEDDVSA
jgi:hypothetical protein